MGERLGYLAEFFRREIPGFDLVAYTDPAPVGLQRIDIEVSRHLKSYTNLEGMLEKESLDLVMVGSPNKFHYEQLSLLLEANVRAFCEKPVVVSENQSIALLKRLRPHGSERIIMGLVLRYSPLYTDLLRIVDKGLLGDIVSMEASEHIDPAHGAFFLRDWRRKSELSGGFLLEKCCHDLDLYAGLLNSRARRVSSFGGRTIFTAQNRDLERQAVYRRRVSRWNGTPSAFSDDADIVDHQVAIIEYENGAKLSFHTSLHAPEKSRRLCVIGTKGMAEGDFVRGYLRAHCASTGRCTFDAKYRYDSASKHYGAETEMAKSLRGHFETGLPLPASVVGGLEAGLTALKIDESRMLGRVVDLAELWSRFDRFAPRHSATSGMETTRKTQSGIQSGRGGLELAGRG